MYSRKHNEKRLTFGVSGKLWKNALVMYDRETGTLWSHLTGEALVGPLAGQELTMLASVPKIKWRDWVKQYPKTKVLSVRKQEDLRHDTYREYHRSSRTGLFRPDHMDDRLVLKDMVIGVTLDGRQKAYPLHKDFWTEPDTGKQNLIYDRIGDIPIIVYHNPDNYATAVYNRRLNDGTEITFSSQPAGHLIKDLEENQWNLLTGEGPEGQMLNPVPHINIYWFAWADFYPKTKLYRPRTKE